MKIIIINKYNNYKIFFRHSLTKVKSSLSPVTFTTPPVVQVLVFHSFFIPLASLTVTITAPSSFVVLMLVVHPSVVESAWVTITNIEVASVVLEGFCFAFNFVLSIVS